MTVIRPNSISGITSITAQANEINVFRSDGTLAGLQINGINFNNTSGISTLAALNVTGNVSIAGTLTYEDVTNVDSIGIITARSTIDAQGDISIVDKIIHTGDTDTAIRFPAADTISFECAGEEILKIGKSSTELLRISGPVDASTQQEFGIGIAVNDAHTHPAAKITFKEFDASDSRGDLLFYTRGTNNDVASTERMRITHDGKIGINGASTNAMLEVRASNTAHGIKLIDASTSGGSPAFEIISKRQDANNNTAFSSNIYLGKNRTDQKVTSGIRLGTINFGGNHTDGTETNISYSASIQGIASDSFDSKSDMPTDLVFTTGVSGTDKSGESAGKSNVGTERLRIDSRGAVTKPNLPSFNARPPASYSLGDNVNAVVGGTWSTSGTGSFVRGTLANGNSIWNNTNGIFTVPVTGIYFLHWTVFLSNNSTRRDAYIYLNGTGNGNIIARTEIQDDGSGMNKSVAVSTVLSLSVNDTVRFGARTAGGTTIYQTAAPWSYACGHLIG